MSALFSPLELRTLTLPNRIVVSPMCQYSAHDGMAGDWHAVHLGQLAASGAGLLFIEATSVEPEGRTSLHDLMLCDDRTEAALARVCAAIRMVSSIPVAIQLGHAGRKASGRRPWDGSRPLSLKEGGWRTSAPSALAFRDGDLPPAALDKASLKRIRDAFAMAARRAGRLGIDAVEIHAAHGYLLHQFLSPLSNHRTDCYGGDLHNRIRFVCEIFEAVREAFPSERPVGIRLSATDWVEGGWDIEQTIATVMALKARGADFIDVSSGGLSSRQVIHPAPGYQVPFAAAVKHSTSLPTIAVGMITSADMAESVVATGKADLVALARGMLYDPRWPWHAAEKLNATVEVPTQYLRCQPPGSPGLFRTRQGSPG